jgi:hypothetical protein
MKKGIKKRMPVIFGALLCIIGIVTMFFNISYSKTRTEFTKITGSLLARMPDESGVFTEEDIVDLPFPVQKYFRYCGYIGTPKMSSMKAIYQDVDFLFVISDASARGIRSAKRVKQLVDSIKLKIKKIFLVVTKVQEGSLEALRGEIEDTGLELVGTIPLDPLIVEYDLHGRPLVNLPDDAPAVIAVRKILSKAGMF